MRVRKGQYVALRLREPFAGKLYGVAKIAKAPCECKRDVNLVGDGKATVGTKVMDVQWYCRVGDSGLTFSETDELQTVLASRLIQVRLSWARVRGRSRRGAREGHRELSTASDEEVSQLLADDPSRDEEVHDHMGEEENDEPDEGEADEGAEVHRHTRRT